MKRSTKRVVGWGSGVAIGIVIILVAVVLLIATSNAPSTEEIKNPRIVSADTAPHNEH